jgi:hypothetical protein
MQSLGHSHIPRRRAGQLCQHLPGARVEPECQADQHGRCSLPSAAVHPPQGYPWPLRDPLAALQQTPDPDPVYREQGGPLVRRTPPALATGPAKGLTAIFRKLAGVVGMAIPGWSDLAHTPRVGRFGWAGLLVTNLGVR